MIAYVRYYLLLIIDYLCWVGICQGKQVAMGIVYNKKNPLSDDKGFLKIK